MKSKRGGRWRAAVLVLACIWIAAAYSAPKIEIVDPEHDAGVVDEGTKEEASHAFVVRNAGNETLVIKDVRPG
jgi:hypothetical protein